MCMRKHGCRQKPPPPPRGDLKGKCWCYYIVTDIDRRRSYAADKLLCRKLTSKPFFLVREDFLQKLNKSEMIHELQKDLPKVCPVLLPQTFLPTTTTWCHASCRSGCSICREGMTTSGDSAFKKELHRFLSLSWGSLKLTSHLMCTKTDPNEITVTGKKSLPNDTSTFWTSLYNKYSLWNLIHKSILKEQDRFKDMTLHNGKTWVRWREEYMHYQMAKQVRLSH